MGNNCKCQTRLYFGDDDDQSQPLQSYFNTYGAKCYCMRPPSQRNATEPPTDGPEVGQLQDQLPGELSDNIEPSVDSGTQEDGARLKKMVDDHLAKRAENGNGRFMTKANTVRFVPNLSNQLVNSGGIQQLN